MQTSSDTPEPLPAEPQFMRLFLQHEPVLRAYARTMLADWDSIDDALQESSVVMWQKLSQLNSEDGFLPWAKVIVRFKCLQAVERSRRNGPLLSAEVLNQLADEVEGTTISNYTDMKTALNACLSEFSTVHQELLLSPYGGDGSVKRMAEQVGKSANAFYKTLGRLRAKLTDCIRSRIPMEGI